jgi:tRNA-Thr(GGU) m(6)t(6)A37 methyltransferase TsaA
MAGESAVFRPIGHVKNGILEVPEGGWEDVVSEIEVDPSLTEALEGLEENSHILVVYWLHLIYWEEPLPLRIHPMDRRDLPLVGLFATRTQRRPNPIGITTVELLRREGNRLTVRGLDAIDGSPVLDLKPLLPERDLPEARRMPEWARRL